MSDPRVLILGGTAEARALAATLEGAGVPVVSSLAGRVARPRLPVGAVRIGGFGGPRGLAAWLAAHGIVAVVDATHPFAKGISASASVAAPAAGVPLLRLERPGWEPRAGDDWHWVGDLAEAARAVPRLGTRVLLTSGRQGLAVFAGVEEAWFLVRCVDPPDPPFPPRHEVLLDRGPYTVAGEAALCDAHGIDLLVTKDSGGPLTEAKLEVARDRGMPVIVVRRPPRLDVETVRTVEAAADWVQVRGRPAGADADG